MQPSLGHSFTREDDEAGRPVAVLSDALWARLFARDPAAIGRPILLDRRPFTIVGVMPRGFTFPQRGPLINNVPADVRPDRVHARTARLRQHYNISVIARLKAGVTTTQADADTRALVRSNASDLSGGAQGPGCALGGSAASLAGEVIGRSRTLLWVASGRSASFS